MRVQIDKRLGILKRPRELDAAQEVPVTVDGRVAGRNHGPVLVQGRCPWRQDAQGRSGGSYPWLHGCCRGITTKQSGKRSARRRRPTAPAAPLNMAAARRCATWRNEGPRQGAVTQAAEDDEGQKKREEKSQRRRSTGSRCWRERERRTKRARFPRRRRGQLPSWSQRPIRPFTAPSRLLSRRWRRRRR